MSTLKVNTIQDTSGNTQYTAKAWVNFNGTGTVAIRASGNVSSITDNGNTGNYTVNFSTAMSDANYAFTLGAGIGDANAGTIASYSMHQTVNPTTTSLTVMSGYSNTTRDVEYFCVAVFR
jgi:hypothetical protein